MIALQLKTPGFTREFYFNFLYEIKSVYTAPKKVGRRSDTSRNLYRPITHLHACRGYRNVFTLVNAMSQ